MFVYEEHRTQREMGAETGVKWPPAEQCMRLPESEEARKDPLLGPSKGAWPYQHLISDFEPPEL